MSNAGDDDRRNVIFKGAGCRAREEVLAITRLAEAMRLASFRAYLDSAVDLMPALLPAVSISVGVSLSEALQRLRPSAAWPSCAGRNVAPAARRLPSFAALGRRWSMNVSTSDVDAHPSRIGAAIISDGAFLDWAEIAATGRWLEIALRSDAFKLATHEGAARLKLPGRLPDLVLSTCPGRPLDDVVDHALLRGRGLVIDTASGFGSETVLHFRVDATPVRFPWRA